MITDYSKPLPEITEDNQPFWDGCREHKLLLQRCSRCGHLRDANPLCPECWASDHDWVEASGRGSVYSWIVVHQCYSKAFEDDLPYNVAIVELEEGPRLLTTLMEIDNDDIRPGMQVEVVFEDVTEEVTLPKFRPRP